MWCFKSDHSGPQLLCIYVQCWSNFFIYTSSFIGVTISWLNLCSSPQPLCVWEEHTFLPCVYTTQATTQLRVDTGWSASYAGRQLKNWVWQVLILYILLAVLWEVHIHLAVTCSSQSVTKRRPGWLCLHFIHSTFAPLFTYSAEQETVVTV